MKAFTYIEKGKFALIEKQKPKLQASTDAIVRVTICHKLAQISTNIFLLNLVESV